MKRLKLAAFKAKNIDQERLTKVDQLLGQVLGDCHDKDIEKKWNKANSGVNTEVTF